jgi:ribosomal protein L32
MGQRQSKKRQVFVCSVAAVSFFVRALLYFYVGAWLFGLAFALVAVALAYSAYKAHLAQQSVEAAWQEYRSGDDKAAAPDPDAYIKKCPECGKFTRDAEVCRVCGHDFDYPPTRPPRTVAESDT